MEDFATGRRHFSLMKHLNSLFSDDLLGNCACHIPSQNAFEAMIFRWDMDEPNPWRVLQCDIYLETPNSFKDTCLMFNIDPENRPSQKESSLPTIIFQGLC